MNVRHEKSGPEERRRLTWQRAADVTPTRPSWLWPGWLAAAVLHLLIGRQGCGKSTFAAWVVATISTGRAFPGDDTRRAPKACAYLSLEESAERLVARLTAAGADLSRVIILADVEDVDDEGRPFRRPWRLPQDCSALEHQLVAQGMGFVVIDGLGYSIAGDSKSYATVGTALTALASVAERTGAAILGLTHPPKGVSVAVTAAIGSTAWTAVPRLTWVLGPDPEDEKQRVVAVGKSNYRYPDDGVAFSLGSDEQYECAFVTRLAASQVAADDLVAAQESSAEKSERAEARDFLRALLADGPMDTAEVNKAAQAAGVGDLKRARRDLGVVAEPRKDPKTGKVIGWTSRLPDKANTTGTHPEGPSLPVPLVPLDLTREFALSNGPEERAAERVLLEPSVDESLFEFDPEECAADVPESVLDSAPPINLREIEQYLALYEASDLAAEET